MHSHSHHIQLSVMPLKLHHPCFISNCTLLLCSYVIMCRLLDAGIVPYVLCKWLAQICEASCLGTHVLSSARCIVSQGCAELLWTSMSRSCCIASCSFDIQYWKRSRSCLPFTVLMQLQACTSRIPKTRGERKK